MKKIIKFLLFTVIGILIVFIFFEIGNIIKKSNNNTEIINNANKIENQNSVENVTKVSQSERVNSIYDNPNIDYEELISKRTPDNVTLKLKSETLTKTGATFIITDKNEISYEYGEEYIIEKKKNGKWKKMFRRDIKLIYSDDLTYFVIRNVVAEHKYDWSKKYGELKKGEYRLGIKVADKYIYAEFTIE